MITALLLSVLLQASSAPVALSVDLDGDGSPESVLATPHGRRIAIEVRNEAGKRLSRAEAPAPDARIAEIALTSGSLGSAGTLLEVSAAAGDRVCRTIWRLRGRELTSLPIVGSKGRLADCSNVEGWVDRWERPRADAPADYVRERTRPTPEGIHHRTEIYRFAGFELQLDPDRSTAEIGGIAIPNWTALVLYPKAPLDALSASFDFSSLKKAPRLQIVTNREEGAFALIFERPSGRQRVPVTAAAPGREKDQWILTAGAGSPSGRLHVQIGLDHHTPMEVMGEGLGEDLNQTYVPVSRVTSKGLELFPTAEDSLALQALVGFWDSRLGQRIQVTSVSLDPAVVDFGPERVALSIARAPAGSDVLLLPRDGSPPNSALLLRGPGVFARLPVSCEAGGAEACRIAGSGEIYRRLGMQMNAR